MVVFLLAVAALAFLFCVILGVRDGVKRGNTINKSRSPSVIHKTATRSSSDEVITLKAVAMMCETFDNIGWFSWESSVHFQDGQAERIKRAATDRAIKLLEYDDITGEATIQGSKGNIYSVSEHSCTCMDFAARGFPCKHIYLLAMELDNT